MSQNCQTYTSKYSAVRQVCFCSTAYFTQIFQVCYFGEIYRIRIKLKNKRFYKNKYNME